MRRHLLYVLFIALLAVACEDEFEFSNPLSLASEKLVLDASEGSTPVIVYANGSWTASLTEGADWAHIESTSGSGLGQVLFFYEANEGLSRKAVLKITAGKNVRIVELVQKSGIGDVELYFQAGEIELPRNAASGEIPFYTNLPESETEKITVQVQSEEGTEVSWLSGVTLTGSAVAMTVSADTEAQDREAVITISYVDLMDEEHTSKVKLIQKDRSPFLSFSEESISAKYSPLASTVSLPVTTNLLPYIQRILAASGSSENWVEISSWDQTTSAFQVNLEENTSADSRTSTLTFPFTDGEGVTATFSYILTQKGAIPQLSFEDVKNLVQSGSYIFTEEGAIEGVIISDNESPNMETATNLSPSSLDKDLNAKTAYIQSADGKSGFRLVFVSKEDNTLHKGDKLTLDLHGVTIKKESAPERYTIEGVTAGSLSVDGQAELMPRELTISELNDSDIYTLVKITGLEMSFKHGAYTNCHDGYSASVSALNPAGSKTNESGSNSSPQIFDTTPCSMFDAAGNEINLLINNNVTWRRYGNGVPQGTCNVTGILVHTDISRWARNGYLGRYQLRPMAEADIEPVGEPFSKVIFSWYGSWGDSTLYGDAAIASGLKTDGTITYNVGSVQTSINFNDLTNYFESPGYSGRYKGQVKNAALGFVKTGGYFWASDNIDDMSAAPWFCLNFSTAGLSGNSMLLVWSAAQGSSRGATDDIQGPTQYRVEYSTDGSNFTAIDHIYAMHPVVTWSAAVVGGFSVPGLHQYVTALPVSLLGQNSVWVRIRAASNVSLDNDYLTPEGGTIKKYTSSNYTMVRFGELTVLYN
ncbi:MAG: hypothetical protein IJQ52_00350 [Bacteroidales bacterium]|nr:hypothetical protein [Bacteroidales bacterium]